MEKIVWDDKFEIGVEVVDKAHAKLFRIMEKLMELSEDPDNNQHTYKEGVKYLEDYSMTHFAEEEAYMRSIQFKGYGHHKRIHDNFRDRTLISLKKDLELSGYSANAVQRFVGVMNRWLTEHIMVEDQAIVGRIPARKGYDLSAQLPIISRAVDRAMQDVCQVGAKLVQADYKGQNIGKGVYCCHCFELGGGIRVQLLLGMEEPLLLRGVNRLLEQGLLEKSEVADKGILQVFGRIFQDTGRLFRVEEEVNVARKCLLNKDRFRKEFMKGYPCSLLFSTKVGYLIFCYRSWRVKCQKAAAAAEKE